MKSTVKKLIIAFDYHYILLIFRVVFKIVIINFICEFNLNTNS